MNRRTKTNEIIVLCDTFNLSNRDLRIGKTLSPLEAVEHCVSSISSEFVCWPLMAV